ncbi:class I SAM-dependent methyltransferase [Paenibacillus eucommiae]|uniref:Ubiquinone/menaquinone biosynthesis C-methylase UbiE n=1 Tax=Paenibacillus eucommiae TaxID=1355755 RepID=A0ABS4JA36_9BACL|nr:class I SAM-dependent methyltransferase [Paenibacillus eucommiae]MBP1996711.1 ubiquinone/menaquinone biosynthesis C-methylase UbiE [Paenibacillus eucommiae]
MSMLEGNEKVVREEFKKQARGFSNKLLSLNNEELLNWIHNSLNLKKEMKVLDVASGTGILSRSIAPFVNHVNAIDLSQDMIDEGIRQNKRMNITNIDFKIAHAEQLPFDHGTFDLVISRLAFHHLISPSMVLNEMCRVSAVSGSVCVVDMISPENDKLYNLYNRYERLRDPSHTYALKETEYVKMFKENNLDIQDVETIEVPINAERWLTLTCTDDIISGKIRKDIELELETKNVITGLFPFSDNGEIKFKQKWIKILGKS